MIETTIRSVDDVNFISDIRILEPDGRRNGIRVHYISFRLEDNAPQLISAIHALGLRKVGEDFRRGVSLYAQYPLPWAFYKVIRGIMRVYWGCLCWLYDNARVFKQIPHQETFSWRYFTPYTWFKELKK